MASLAKFIGISGVRSSKPCMSSCSNAGELWSAQNAKSSFLPIKQDKYIAHRLVVVRRGANEHSIIGIERVGLSGLNEEQRREKSLDSYRVTGRTQA